MAELPIERLPGIKSDTWIAEMCKGDNPMISPFVQDLKEEGVISYGLGSYGYDFRCDNIFKVFKKDETSWDTAFVDPKDLSSRCYDDVRVAKGGFLELPPHGFALASTVEYFRIPENVLAIFIGKSTYARCGIIVNVTPGEPGWEGILTLEISNTTPLPCLIYPGEGICQGIFFEGAPCEVSYKSRKGKYQNQTGITIPKIK